MWKRKKLQKYLFKVHDAYLAQQSVIENQNQIIATQKSLLVLYKRQLEIR